MRARRLILFLTFSFVLINFTGNSKEMSKTCDVSRETKIYVLKDPRDEQVRYVGKTVITLERRLQQHIYDSKRKVSRHVSNWIQSLMRLGLNPVIEEIDSCTWIESQLREIHWIRFHKSLGCRLCNHTIGGEGNLGNKHSEEQRVKFKESVRSKSKPVYQYSMAGNFISEYRSAKDAAEMLGLHYSNITQCCHGAKGSHGNFVWSFERKDSLSYKRLPCCNKLRRKLDCYDLNWNFIRTYDSFTEAARDLNIYDTNIYKVLSGRYEQTGGYKFKLHD